MSVKSRIEKLENKDSAGGLIVIKIYPGMTKEQALDGRNPKPNDLVVILRKPDPFDFIDS